MKATLTDVFNNSEDYLREYIQEYAVGDDLKMRVAQVLMDRGELVKEDAEVFGSKWFKNYYTDDLLLGQVCRNYTPYYVTRLEAVLFTMVRMREDKSASFVLGRDSENDWLLYYPASLDLITRYIDGVTDSDNLSRMEQYYYALSDSPGGIDLSKLWYAINIYYKRRTALLNIDEVMVETIRAATLEEILELYDNSKTVRDAMSTSKSRDELRKKAGGFVFDRVEELMSYIRSRNALKDCNRRKRTRNSHYCDIQLLASNLKSGSMTYLRNFISVHRALNKEEYMLLCRSAGASGKYEVIYYFLSNTNRSRYPAKDVSTNIMSSYLKTKPTEILKLVRLLDVAHKKEGGGIVIKERHLELTDREEIKSMVRDGQVVFDSDTYNMLILMETLLGMHDSLNDYFTARQLYDNEMYIVHAMLRTGTEPQVFETSRDRYFSSVIGGNVNLVRKMRLKNYDREALSYAIKYGRIPVVRFILSQAEHSLRSDKNLLSKLYQQALDSENEELALVLEPLLF